MRGIVDSRIRVAAYNGDEVYKLRGFVGYQIDLEFEPGETFTGLGAGDLEGLSFVGQDNHLFLKPKAAKGRDEPDRADQPAALSDSTTSRCSQRPAADDRDVIYALRFTYPPPSAQTAADAAAKRARIAIGQCLDQAAAEYRLLVLRRARASARRRVR